MIAFQDEYNIRALSGIRTNTQSGEITTVQQVSPLAYWATVKFKRTAARCGAVPPSPLSTPVSLTSRVSVAASLRVPSVPDVSVGALPVAHSVGPPHVSHLRRAMRRLRRETRMPVLRCRRLDDEQNRTDDLFLTSIPKVACILCCGFCETRLVRELYVARRNDCGYLAACVFGNEQQRYLWCERHRTVETLAK